MPMVPRCDICGKEHTDIAGYQTDVGILLHWDSSGSEFDSNGNVLPRFGVVCKTYECTRRSLDRLYALALENMDKEFHAEFDPKLPKRSPGKQRGQLNPVFKTPTK